MLYIYYMRLLLKYFQNVLIAKGCFATSTRFVEYPLILSIFLSPNIRIQQQRCRHILQVASVATLLILRPPVLSILEDDPQHRPELKVHMEVQPNKCPIRQNIVQHIARLELIAGPHTAAKLSKDVGHIP